MKKKSIFMQIMAVLVVVIVLFVCISSKNEVVKTSSSDSYSGLSNKKIGWGIKRSDNHEQPDVGSENKRIMDKYNALYLGNKEKKYVYLTFDAGYEAGYTEQLLETLRNNNVKATFFITGHYLNTQPDLIKQMIDEGHIVGNHTVNHKVMPDISLEEINKDVMNLHKAMYEKFGYEMKYSRPPKGEFSERTISYTNSLGYTTAMWSLAYDDWDEKKQGREEYAKEKILNNIHNGAIILLHSNSKDNCNILDYIIKEIKNQRL